jgi:hypothetical protein
MGGMRLWNVAISNHVEVGWMWGGSFGLLHLEPLYVFFKTSARAVFHPAFYSVGTGVSSRGQSGKGVKLTIRRLSRA